MKTETLIVERQWFNSYHQVSILKNNDGKVVHIITSANKQPKKNSKTISLFRLGKNITYKLCWKNVK